MNENTIIKVTNRSTSRVFYKIPEMNISREYQPGEAKKITAKEIGALSSQPGGRELVYNFLKVDLESADVIREVTNLEEEPEYWLTEEAIPNWLDSSTVEEFSDALQFAPIGVKDLIKKYAVSKPLNDMNKRQLILQILNFDVTKAIEASAPEEGEMAATTEKTSTRKSSPNYKIIPPKK